MDTATSQSLHLLPCTRAPARTPAVYIVREYNRLLCGGMIGLAASNKCNNDSAHLRRPDAVVAERVPALEMHRGFWRLETHRTLVSRIDVNRWHHRFSLGSLCSSLCDRSHLLPDVLGHDLAESLVRLPCPPLALAVAVDHALTGAAPCGCTALSTLFVVAQNGRTGLSKEASVSCGPGGGCRRARARGCALGSPIGLGISFASVTAVMNIGVTQTTAQRQLAAICWYLAWVETSPLHLADAMKLVRRPANTHASQLLS